MKKIVLLLTVLAVLTGCFTDWQGEGAIAINLGGGNGRNVTGKMQWPNDDPKNDIRNYISHKITITGNNNNYNFSDTFPPNSGTVRQSGIPAGTYTVTVTAILKGKETPLTPNKQEIPYAAGKETVEVKAGQTAQKTIPMTGIDFCKNCVFEITANCTENGALHQSCNKDKHNEDHYVVYELGHIWSGWETTTDPKCTTTGKGNRYCKRDDCEGNETGADIPALEHLIVVDDCTRPGCGITTITYGKNWTAVDDVEDIFATPSTNWTFEAVAYGGDKFVAGGSGGRMAYSSDGENWVEVQNSPFDTTIFAIAYGGDKFVAGGGTFNSSVKMAYSDDGITWKAITSPLGGGQIAHIAYGGGRFVAFCNGTGYNHIMAYSTNGITWETAPNPFGATHINDIIYDGGKFIAFGYSTTVAHSTNGANWETFPRHLGYASFRIAHDGGKFVAANTDSNNIGKMAYSSDGMSWTTVTNPPFGTSAVSAIAYGGGRFFAGSKDMAAYSNDGINWSPANSTASSNHNLTSIAYGNNTVVAVGSNPIKRGETLGVIWYSK
ncbi:MAG: DUF4493 domain-containing protein [Treponema sp.]|jgi:hypothetical protein|nr:DUF4493 domain-containing protein [Treponema sp.]